MANANLRRLVLLVLVWWILVEGDPDGFAFGVPVILLALLLGHRLVPPARARPRLTGVARFLPYFLVQSVLGGWDVALRALRPRVDLDPGFVRHRLHLASEPARVLFVNLVSLLPGTLAARLEGDEVLVHVLDRRRPVARDLDALEHRVADLFGEAETLRAPAA